MLEKNTCFYLHNEHMHCFGCLPRPPTTFPTLCSACRRYWAVLCFGQIWRKYRAKCGDSWVEDGECNFYDLYYFYFNSQLLEIRKGISMPSLRSPSGEFSRGGLLEATLVECCPGAARQDLDKADAGGDKLASCPRCFLQEKGMPLGFWYYPCRLL